MLALAAVYLTGALSAWLVIPAIALCCAVAHELEHDLIHNLYFPRNPRIQNAMFALVWAMRPHTISPWKRRTLHLLHHRVSGTHEDIEEQAITNGVPWGPRRLLMLADGGLAVLLRVPWRNPRAARVLLTRTAQAYFPLGFVHYGLWYAFLAVHAFGYGIGWLDALAVVWLAPNVLRSFCLNLVSSNMHYYGDVAKGEVMQQTQVLNHWIFLPFQLFCLNFGSTHGIHHFWVPDPFYVRQLTAPRSHQVFRAHGVRFNDLATFRRANRYGVAP